MPAYLYIAYLEPENLALDLKRSYSLSIRKVTEVHLPSRRFAHTSVRVTAFRTENFIYHYFLQVGSIDSCLIKLFKMN